MDAEQIRKKAKEKEGKARKFKVEDWGVEIWYSPITVADTQYISQKVKDFGDDENWAIELIMLKALDKGLKRIWTTEEDREFLRTKVKKILLARMVAELGGLPAWGVEKAKKNFTGTSS